MKYGLSMFTMEAGRRWKSTALAVGFFPLALASYAAAQGSTYSIVHSFQNPPDQPAFAVPTSLIRGSDGALYGVSQAGGSDDGGTVFKVNPDGSGFRKIHEFTFATRVNGAPTLGGGALVGSSGILYGTTAGGGTSGLGVLFRMNEDGSGFAKLHDFDGSGGSFPYGPPIESGGVLYGRAAGGGATGGGILYKVSTDGTGFVKLHDFQSSDGGFSFNRLAGLTLSGGVLYGTGREDGDPGLGFIFRINTDGTVFAKIHEFDATTGSSGASLVASGGFLYGTTNANDVSFRGTVFKINTDGTGLVHLHEFDATTTGPFGGLTEVGGTLYGVVGSPSSGSAGYGSLFKINEDGSGYAKLHDFGTTGAYPFSSFVSAGSVLYGFAVTPFVSGVYAPGYGLIYAINTDGTGYTDLRDLERSGGALPNGLSASGGVLFGTTRVGGASDGGTLFRLNEDGTAFTRLHDFGSANDPQGTNPTGDLTLSSGVFYGTTGGGGTSSRGIVYRINSDGTAFAKLHDFDGVNGAFPYGNLTLSSGVLYGTTNGGGTLDQGVIFKINADGTGFQKLHDFDVANGNPSLGLVESAGVLYGTTSSGGAAGRGTLYSVNTDGTSYVTLRDFDDASGSLPNGLVGSGSVLYGTTAFGGASGRGVIFSINADGTGFTRLHDFDGANGGSPTNLSISGGLLYGTTAFGGASGTGVAFRMNLNGTGFTTIHDFDSTSGAPATSAVLPGTDGALYGLANRGPQDGGVVFRVAPPAVTVPPAGSSPVPFGFFDTPLDGSTGAQGAIGVTGWALDDFGVSKLELWRDPVNGDPAPAPNGKIFIGNATFVSGARPDVQALYAAYPQSDRAGWGYMLLTNLLPNVTTGAPSGGVGTFTLYAYIYDFDGHVTQLPTRTFTCDNAAGANKPFGTIDTPTQGQTVSGTLANFGWVLTPQPGAMPTDGSTIVVYIDGIPRGTVLYNLFRSDVATLFPGYANTNGAIGYFSIDTTTLSNGVHTIAWSATDNLGRADGIGSRYFTVQN